MVVSLVLFTRLLKFILHVSLYSLLQAFVVIDFKHFVPGEERRIRLLQLLDPLAELFVFLCCFLLFGQKLFFLFLQPLHPIFVLVVQSLEFAELVRHRLCFASFF